MNRLMSALSVLLLTLPLAAAALVPPADDGIFVEGTRYDAVLETKVAYLRFKFKVTVELTRIDPPREIEAKIEGTPLGVVGRLTAASRTRLSEDPAGTLVEYEIDSALTGKLGGIGQPVLKSKAKQMEQQFFARLRAAFEEAAPAEAP